MSQVKPIQITIELSDGSRVTAPFDSLPASLKSDILKQPIVSRPNPNPGKEAFVLLEWDDGWSEVIEVDAGFTDLNRYYVISRREDVGRLSLNGNEGYPELIEILRRPLNLSKITFLNTFRLSLEQSKREGKKTDHFFALNQEDDAFAEALNTFKKAVADEGLDLQKLQSQHPSELQEEYEMIRKKMGIKASQRQQDALDFIAFLAKNSN